MWYLQHKKFNVSFFSLVLISRLYIYNKKYNHISCLTIVLKKFTHKRNFGKQNVCSVSKKTQDDLIISYKKRTFTHFGKLFLILELFSYFQFSVYFWNVIMSTHKFRLKSQTNRFEINVALLASPSYF